MTTFSDTSSDLALTTILFYDTGSGILQNLDGYHTFACLLITDMDHTYQLVRHFQFSLFFASTHRPPTGTTPNKNTMSSNSLLSLRITHPLSTNTKETLEVLVSQSRIDICGVSRNESSPFATVRNYDVEPNLNLNVLSLSNIEHHQWTPVLMQPCMSRLHRKYFPSSEIQTLGIPTSNKMNTDGL